MAVIPEIATHPVGVTTPKSPRPNHIDMPAHLIKAEGINGNHRGSYVEERVRLLLSGQSQNIERAGKNKNGGHEDSLGHALTLTLTDSPVRVVYVQVKSSRDGVVKYKRRIRDLFPPEQRDSA